MPNEAVAVTATTTAASRVWLAHTHTHNWNRSYVSHSIWSHCDFVNFLCAHSHFVWYTFFVVIIVVDQITSVYTILFRATWLLHIHTQAHTIRSLSQQMKHTGISKIGPGKINFLPFLNHLLRFSSGTDGAERNLRRSTVLSAHSRQKFQLILIPLYLSFVWCRSDQCDLTTCLHKSGSGNVYALWFNTQCVWMRESFAAYFKLNCHQDYIRRMVRMDVESTMYFGWMHGGEFFSIDSIRFDSIRNTQSANAFTILFFASSFLLVGFSSVWVVMEILNSFIGPFIYLRC